jgi:hypothetical protein
MPAESQLFGNVGATFAANLDQSAGILLLRLGDLEEPLHALQERHAGPDMGEGIMQAFPSYFRPVLRFQVALGLNIVRIQDMKEPGRVAAASRVLEQQRIIQVGLLVRAHADLLGNAHSDHARAYGMPHGLAFGQVQGVGKCGNNIGQTNRGGGLGAFNARKHLRSLLVNLELSHRDPVGRLNLVFGTIANSIENYK